MKKFGKKVALLVSASALTLVMGVTVASAELVIYEGYSSSNCGCTNVWHMDRESTSPYSNYYNNCHSHRSSVEVSGEKKRSDEVGPDAYSYASSSRGWFKKAYCYYNNTNCSDKREDGFKYWSYKW